MKTIQLHLPDDLASKVMRIGGNAETFIIDILRTRIKELDNSGTLSEQYRNAAKENISLQDEFTHTDTEGWGDEY